MTKFINLHTHQFSNDTQVLEVVNQYPWEFDSSIPTYSIGIHPWYIDENRLVSDLYAIEEKLKEASCLALGECGLDKRIEIPLETQIQVFHQQLVGHVHRLRAAYVVHRPLNNVFTIFGHVQHAAVG